MGINMSYCMFENTVTALEQILEKMWEPDFDPNTLSSHERIAFDKLYDIASSIHSAIDEYEERDWEKENLQDAEEGTVEQHYLESGKTFSYNPNYGDDRICQCGHIYYRHFDSYENMEAVGCKYCGCYEFIEKLDNQ